MENPMSSPPPSCTLLSPALPSEFLSYVLDYHVHPTTVIICSSRADFLASLAEDVCGHASPSSLDDEQERGRGGGGGEGQATTGPEQPPEHRLLRSPIYQVAVSRHLRTVYVPTATHLRAYLSVFSAGDDDDASRVVAAPPARFATAAAAASKFKRRPHLLLYGFLDLHRDTSEWSAQGLGSSASALVDLSHRLQWDVVVVEPRRVVASSSSATGGSQHAAVPRLGDVLRETVPVLSSGGRKLGLESEDGGWSGRRVEVGRVLMRWFRFQRGKWEEEEEEEEKEDAKGDQEDMTITDNPLGTL